MATRKVKGPESAEVADAGNIVVSAEGTNIVSAHNPKSTCGQGTPEHRQRTIDGRTAARVAFFGSDLWQVVSGYRVSLDWTERYVDPSGNKGIHGWFIQNTRTGEIRRSGEMSIAWARERGIVSGPEITNKRK